MAGSKTQLLIRDHYAKLAAVELASRLVSRYEMREPGPEAIRVEALGAEDWDDVQEIWCGQQQTRWQIKRQRTPYTEATFSELIRSSALIVGKHVSSCRVGFHDWTSVAVGKAPHELRVLDEMCKDLRRPGVDRTAFLQSLTQAQRDWLALVSDWLGAPPGDNKPALEVLTNLHLKCLGSEEEIRQRCIDSLAMAYENADALFDSIVSFVDANPTGILTVTYGVLASEVLRGKGKRRPSVRHWITFSRNAADLQLKVSGSVAVQDVPARLRAGGGIDVVSCGPHPVTEHLCRQLVRLHLHHDTLVRLEVENAASWEKGAERLYAGTLGLRKDSDPTLKVAEVSPSSKAELASATADGAALGQLIDSDVGSATWKSIIGTVTAALADPQTMDLGPIEASLLTSMNVVWANWLPAISGADAQAKLARSLLSTSQDFANRQFDFGIRFGPRTVHHIGRAIVAGLALAGSFPGSKINLDREALFNLTLSDLVEVHMLALAQAWCGAQMRPVAIDSPTASFLLSGEATSLLASSQSPAEDLFDVLKDARIPYHRVTDERDRLAEVGSPPPIITLDVTFLSALAKGASAVRTHVENLVRRSIGEPSEMAARIAARPQ